MAFLDTNVLVYAFIDDPRARRAQALLDGRARISVQSLNEFTLVARRKLRFDWQGVYGALDDIAIGAPSPIPLTFDIHRLGLAIAEQHGFRIYDALIIASALSVGADTLWSEDMHDGLVIANRLTIRNPFRV
jgi:predicted nucleic acid-binding protein